MDDLGRGEGAAGVRGVGGGALAAESGEWGGGGGRERYGAGFGDVEDVEGAAGAGLDLGAG